jgi:hypothetical protein
VVIKGDQDDLLILNDDEGSDHAARGFRKTIGGLVRYHQRLAGVDRAQLSSSIKRGVHERRVLNAGATVAAVAKVQKDFRVTSGKPPSRPKLPR